MAAQRHKAHSAHAARSLLCSAKQFILSSTFPLSAATNFFWPWIFVFDSARVFLVSQFFCAGCSAGNTRRVAARRGTSRHVAARRGTSRHVPRGPQKIMCLYILSSLAAARSKTTLRANPAARRGTSRHVTVFGGASAAKSDQANYI